MTLTTSVLTLSLSLLGGAPADDDDADVIVEMTAKTFEPEHVEIRVGDTIKWTNPSAVFHTVTADPDKAVDPDNVKLPEGVEPFGSGRIRPDETYKRRFDVPGSYKYFCIPHEDVGMIGTIEVKPAD